MKPGKPVKPKSKCCKDSPRCKKCPVVLKCLANQGLCEKLDCGRYVFQSEVSKKALKSARKRK